jgi:hypothetical protein
MVLKPVENQLPLSCGTMQLAVASAVFPAKSPTVAVRLYTRPLPLPERSARS